MGNVFKNQEWPDMLDHFLTDVAKRYGPPTYAGKSNLTVVRIGSTRISLLIWRYGDISVVAKFSGSTVGQDNKKKYCRVVCRERILFRS